MLKGLAAGAATMTVLMAATASLPAEHVGRFLAPPGQVVAIRAGRLYEPQSGHFLANQVIIVRGDRIADVGSDLAIPAGAKVIDLSGVAVMPGMIDSHVHVTVAGDTPAERAIWSAASAQSDLEAGFTTVKDMDSRGGFGIVDLRELINQGIVLGPRMQVVGQSLNNRNMRYVKDENSGKFYGGRTENKDVNGPWLARAAVREAKNHGVDYIKIYSTEDYVADTHLWLPDGSFQVFSSLTAEEAIAIVDEAHRLGLKVACHSYDGTGKDPCLIAPVDEPNHLLQLDADGVALLKKNHAIYVPTVDDLIGLEKEDMEATHGRNSRIALLSAAVKRAKAAGIEMAFGSGATEPPWGDIPHGKQANQFKWFVDQGLTPVEALRMTYIGSAHTLNYHMQAEIGTVEKGKYADIIAVVGDPLRDITEMERVKFVMKGGMVVRDEASAAVRPGAP
jgi:imidazolonepropionase-like amidohydrolase